MSFTLFPKLPFELRTEIFAHACELRDPQVIQISRNGQGHYGTAEDLQSASPPDVPQEETNDKFEVTVHNSITDNPLYYTRKDYHIAVRDVIQKRHVKLFGERLPHPILMDVEIDTLYFSDFKAIEKFLNIRQDNRLNVQQDFSEILAIDCQNVTSLAVLPPFYKRREDEGHLVIYSAST